jgi:hypothetical protein
LADHIKWPPAYYLVDRAEPEIGVFCGFGTEVWEADNGISEKDFAYRVVCICANGELTEIQEQPGQGNANLNYGSEVRGLSSATKADNNTNYIFHAVVEFGDQGVFQADSALIARSDIILIILPLRANAENLSKLAKLISTVCSLISNRTPLNFKKHNTSLYTLFEAACSLVSNKPVFPVVEDGVNLSEVPFLQSQLRFRRAITRHNIKEYANGIKQAFDDFLREGIATRKTVEVKDPDKDVELDELYRILLYTLLLNCHNIVGVRAATTS